MTWMLTQKERLRRGLAELFPVESSFEPMSAVDEEGMLKISSAR